MTFDLSRWPGSLAPVWTLLDAHGLKALSAEPSPDNRALRLVPDIDDEALGDSVLVRKGIAEQAAATAPTADPVAIKIEKAMGDSRPTSATTWERAATKCAGPGGKGRYGFVASKNSRSA